MAKKPLIRKERRPPVQHAHTRRIKTRRGIEDIRINPRFKRPIRAQILSPRVRPELPGKIPQKKRIITPRLKPDIQKKPLVKDREVKIEFQKMYPGVDFDSYNQFTKDVGLGEIGKPMSGYSYPLQRGSLWKYIPVIDSLTNKRWLFWGQAIATGKIPEKIPQIKFLSMPDDEVMKMLKKNVQYRISRGSSNYQAVEDIFDWILWAIGDPGTKKPPGIDKETNEFWYRNINLGIMMDKPHDYPARLLEEFGVRAGPGWFATPMGVTQMMASMIGTDKAKPWESVNDCCAGTGSMLLPASNFSLNIFGSDISATVLKGLRINAYLYVPWMVRPFPQRMLDDLKKRIERRRK